MIQALWVAFTHIIEVALACASRAVQDIHGVIECLFLFYVVSGLLKQFPRTYGIAGLLRSCPEYAVGKFKNF